MINAINKDGRTATFSERVWALMPKGKNGWMIYEGDSPDHYIPAEIVEFQAKKKVVAVVTEEKPKFESNATATDKDEEMLVMKEHLDSLGIKYHHKAGYEKIKALYDGCKE